MANTQPRIPFPAGAGDATKPRWREDDRYLSGYPEFAAGTVDAGGVTMLIDTAYAPGFAPAAPIVDGTPIRNIAHDAFFPHPYNASVVVAAGATLGMTGGMIDFSTITATGTYVRIDPNAMASIFADATRRYMIAAVFRLPTEANWNPSGQNMPLLSFATALTGYAGGPDLLTIAGVSTGANADKSITMYRQTTALNVADTFRLLLGAGHPAFGAVCLVYYYWDSTGQHAGLYVCPPGGVTAATHYDMPPLTALTNARNTVLTAALPCLIGITTNRWGANLPSTTAKNFGFGRATIENLNLSGRNPALVLSRAAARIVARGAFG